MSFSLPQHTKLPAIISSPCQCLQPRSSVAKVTEKLEVGSFWVFSCSALLMGPRLSESRKCEFLGSNPGHHKFHTSTPQQSRSTHTHIHTLQTSPESPFRPLRPGPAQRTPCDVLLTLICRQGGLDLAVVTGTCVNQMQMDLINRLIHCLALLR